VADMSAKRVQFKVSEEVHFRLMAQKPRNLSTNQFLLLLLDIRRKYNIIQDKKRQREMDKFWRRPDVKAKVLEAHNKARSGELPISNEIRINKANEAEIVPSDGIYLFGGHFGRPKGSKDSKPRTRRKKLAGFESPKVEVKK
jgi:hypothetical protein